MSDPFFFFQWWFNPSTWFSGTSKIDRESASGYLRTSTSESKVPLLASMNTWISCWTKLKSTVWRTSTNEKLLVELCWRVITFVWSSKLRHKWDRAGNPKILVLNKHFSHFMNWIWLVFFIYTISLVGHSNRITQQSCLLSIINFQYSSSKLKFF